MPNPHVTRDRVDQEVRAALATTLRTDADAIEMDTSIVTGLGATSIDFLDINFRLENAFGVQLATQLLLDHVEEELGEALEEEMGDEGGGGFSGAAPTRDSGLYPM